MRGTQVPSRLFRPTYEKGLRCLKEYTFKIKNKKWTIKQAQTNSEHLMMNGEPCIAQLYKQLRVIYFDERLLEDYHEFRETIVHELTHAFIMTYAISPKEFRDEEFICEFNAVYGQDIQNLAEEIMCEYFA